MPDEAKTFTLTLVREGGHECVELPGARVRLRGPTRNDQCVDLGLRPVVVGSAPDCDIVVDDPYVSRRHCEITMTSKGVILRDLGSRNGVWMQTTRILDAVLAHGSSVTLGKLSLTVEGGGTPARVSLSAGERFGDAVGKSMVMRALFARLERAAQTDEAVLLLGESGTGKELLAQAIHRVSARRDGPFVVFDCGAVAPSLVESELFGHEKGAFSGASSARTGLVQAAHGGSLFLDEIGELPFDVQPKLLRMLENRTVRAVGGNRVIPIDVRIVAATHRNLSAGIADGHFREDLYYRLAVVDARVPPLRERREDIPLLAEQLLASRSPPSTLADLPPNTLEMLAAHSWPGNVRELRNTLSRIILFRGSDMLEHPAAPSPIATDPMTSVPFHEAREVLVADFEQRYVTAQLRAHGGNISSAARAMGVSRQFLHKLIAEHGLKST